MCHLSPPRWGDLVAGWELHLGDLFHPKMTLMMMNFLKWSVRLWYMCLIYVGFSFNMFSKVGSNVMKESVEAIHFWSNDERCHPFPGWLVVVNIRKFHICIDPSQFKIFQLRCSGTRSMDEKQQQTDEAAEAIIAKTMAASKIAPKWIKVSWTCTKVSVFLILKPLNNGKFKSDFATFKSSIYDKSWWRHCWHILKEPHVDACWN